MQQFSHHLPAFTEFFQKLEKKEKEKSCIKSMLTQTATHIGIFVLTVLVADCFSFHQKYFTV